MMHSILNWEATLLKLLIIILMNEKRMIQKNHI